VLVTVAKEKKKKEKKKKRRAKKKKAEIKQWCCDQYCNFSLSHLLCTSASLPKTLSN
jgi:hypothetical protein